jgi:mRNA interferase MazF
VRVNRGDIVLVDYPFSDRTGSKVRPSLVVQSDALNCRIDDTILAAISRSTHRVSATQLYIDISTPDGAATGLRQNSTIQCENRLTYDQRLIIAQIGQLSDAQLQQIGIACATHSIFDQDID